MMENIDLMKVWIIELNPFMESTDGALFTWLYERHSLEGQTKENIFFRVTNKARPGSWTMLPISIRQWIKNDFNRKTMLFFFFAS